VISKASSDFWKGFEVLPRAIQRQAREQYSLFKRNPQHPSLNFKHLAPGLVSVRVTINYRALGRQTNDTILWFWIGTHAEYDKLIG
jgi:hypothetical protein